MQRERILPSVVAGGQVERLGSICGPLRLVVELSGVPDDLVHELRDSDGVGGRARTSQAQEVGRAGRRVGDVVLVVGAVQVLAIPASREENVGSDTSSAHLVRQSLRVDTMIMIIVSHHELSPLEREWEN